MAQRDYGLDIRNRLPTHSPLQISGNLGRILIDSCVGVEYASIEDDIFTNSQGRFLEYAEGVYLDYYGDWFGVHRDGRSDSEYRNVLITLRTADCTISGVKIALAVLLGLETSDINIYNTYSIAESNPEPLHQNYFDFGDDISAERPSDNPRQYWRAHNTGVSTKSMTIEVPTGSDTGLIEDFIPRLTVPNVTVTILEV